MSKDGNQRPRQFAGKRQLPRRVLTKMDNRVTDVGLYGACHRSSTNPNGGNGSSSSLGSGIQSTNSNNETPDKQAGKTRGEIDKQYRKRNFLITRKTWQSRNGSPRRELPHPRRPAAVLLILLTSRNIQNYIISCTKSGQVDK